ncbi:hypothetical protein KY290_036319 [Solanum tuberosum]|uniref:Uncharacterized protein n=1 Tax=Solanum tuberosum TaxID=4113 RepID=A0ABQ7TU37_SOLTU|nr:hypothetical protein KY290_036319 [Solanum tuberosum]
MIISSESQRVTPGSYSGRDLGVSIALYVGKDQRQYTSEGSYSGGDAGTISHTSVGAYSGGDVGASTSTALYANIGHQQSTLYKPKRDYTLLCAVCKLKGHTKETCYRVVGYSPDYKFRKKSGNNANRMANVNVVDNDAIWSNSQAIEQGELCDSSSQSRRYESLIFYQ